MGDTTTREREPDMWIIFPSGPMYVPTPQPEHGDFSVAAFVLVLAAIVALGVGAQLVANLVDRRADRKAARRRLEAMGRVARELDGWHLR
jgi:5-enolpyruvylshikimate-3-phosphate synthase